MRLVEVIETGDVLGEGPLWSVDEGRLWWTDIQSRRLRRLDPATRRIEDFPAPERIGSFTFVEGRPGVFLTAFETGLAMFEPATGAVEWLARQEPAGSGRRFNDGRTDRQGRFWVGTMVEDEALAGAASASLWRMDAESGLTERQGGVKISNGLCASPDGATLYFADSIAGSIWAYDLDPATGDIAGRRLFSQAERGGPDGSTVDSQGRVWNARWGAGEVVCLGPDGRELEVVHLAARQPTCVAFGGDDLKLMFVTTATDGLTAAERAAQPLAGGIFVYESEVPGLAEVAYRGSEPAKLG